MAKRKKKKKTAKKPYRRRTRSLTLTGENLNRVRAAIGFLAPTRKADRDMTVADVVVRVEKMREAVREAADKELAGPAVGLIASRQRRKTT